MPAYKEASHNGQTIRFFPDKHIYLNTQTGSKYKSVTQLLHSFKPVFDKEGASARVAEKRGVTQAEVLKEWEDKGSFSRYIGTKCHGYAECLFKDGAILDEFVPIDQNEQKYCDLVIKAIDKLKEKYKFIACEKIVFSNKYMVAGTIDLLMKQDNTVLLLDWKTNEEIKKSNGFQKMLGDLDHLDSCNFNEYALQLNCYRKILLDEGYFDCEIRMGLIHLNPSSGINWIKIPLMDTEMQVLLKGPEEDPDF